MESSTHHTGKEVATKRKLASARRQTAVVRSFSRNLTVFRIADNGCITACFFRWPIMYWYKAITGLLTGTWLPSRCFFRHFGVSSLGKWGATLVKQFECAACPTKVGPHHHMTSPFRPHNDGKSIIFRHCRLTNRRDLLQCGYDNDHVTDGYFLGRCVCWLLTVAVASLMM